MNTDLNGRKISAVHWPDTESEQGRCLVASEQTGDLWLSETSHVDGDELWIVQEKNGVEVARHNMKMVESIYWAEG